MKIPKIGVLAAIIASLVVSLASGPQVQAASRTVVTPMIVGGHNATQQYGSISIWYPDRHRCTASLISPYWAVTAAHCSPVLIPGQTQIRASSLNNTSAYEEVGLAAVYINPNFDPNSFANDIALIKFQRPVKKSQPLALSGNSPTVNMTGKIAGWGWICEDSSNPNCDKTVSILQELDVKVAPDSVCRVWDVDPARQSCLVAANGSNAMACFGDSGGPFVRTLANTSVLMGVASGDGVDGICGTDPTVTGGVTQGSGVWTDVAPYVPWILKTVLGNSAGSQQPVVVR